MVIAYHGDTRGLAEVRSIAAPGRDSLSPNEFLRDTRKLGYTATIVDASAPALDRALFPMIVKLDPDQYVVLEWVTSRRASLVDPRVGRRIVRIEDLNRRADLFVTVQPYDRRPRRFRAFSGARARDSLSLRLLSILRAAHTGAGWLAARSALTAAALQLIPLATAFGIGWLVDRAGTDQPLDLRWGLIALIQYAVASGALMFAHNVVIAHYTARVQLSFLERAIERVIHSRLAYLRTRSATDLVDRVSGVQQVQATVASLIVGASLDLGSLLLYTGFLVALAPPIGLTMLGVVVAYFLALFQLYRLLTHRAYLAAQASAAQRAVGFEIVNSIPSIKSMGSEEIATRRWVSSAREEIVASYKFALMQGTLGSFSMAVQWGVPLAVMGIGVTLVQSGQISLGILVGIQTLLASMLASSTSLTHSLQQFFTGRASWDRLKDIYSVSGDDNPQAGHLTPATFRHRLELKNVGFRYPGSEKYAVREVSCVMKPADIVAIAGPTGSGKSSLINVVLGLEALDEGEITFDGVSTTRLDSTSVRSMFSTVLQDPLLSAGSIRETLAIAAPTANERDLWHALKVAAVDEEVRDLPQGLDTTLGPRGQGLSGGQAQRIAIARAILKAAPIMVLDEATSALDEATEQTVLRNIVSLGRTLIIITHRAATLNLARQVIRLEPDWKRKSK